MAPKKPKIPTLAPAPPAPSAPQTPMQQGGAVGAAAPALGSAFRRFKFAPAMTGFNPSRPGRRSLLGGSE
jgi:hypothetical protein